MVWSAQPLRWGGLMMMMKEWTKEWYHLLSVDQLSDILLKAKESFHNSTRWEQDAAMLMWSFRVKNLEEEISTRATGKHDLKIA
jgi:hypothetical protein